MGALARSLLAACALLPQALLAHGPIVCLQGNEGNALNLVGVSHFEPAHKARADLWQAVAAAQQVLFESDPDTVGEYLRENPKAIEWPTVAEGLSEATRARLLGFLERPPGYLATRNSHDAVFAAIYGRGTVRANAALRPVRPDNLMALEKTIKRVAAANHAAVAEFEGARRYYAAMRDFMRDGYDALVNAALDCAEKIACARDFAAIGNAALEGDVEDYDDFNRRLRAHPSVAWRALPARNATMRRNIVALATGTQNTLVVAGAGHIGGADGLRALLVADGFRPVACRWSRPAGPSGPG